MNRRERAKKIVDAVKGIESPSLIVPLYERQVLDIIERHLCEYGEEAVREECKRWTCTCPKKEAESLKEVKCQYCGEVWVGEHSCCVLRERKGVRPVINHGLSEGLISKGGRGTKPTTPRPPDPKGQGGGLGNRPTAEDALRATRRIAIMMGGAKPSEWNDFGVGCMDLIEGRRDTDAAKAITGEHEGGKR